MVKQILLNNKYTKYITDVHFKMQGNATMCGVTAVKPIPLLRTKFVTKKVPITRVANRVLLLSEKR